KLALYLCRRHGDCRQRRHLARFVTAHGWKCLPKPISSTSRTFSLTRSEGNSGRGIVSGSGGDGFSRGATGNAGSATGLGASVGGRGFGAGLWFVPSDPQPNVMAFRFLGYLGGGSAGRRLRVERLIAGLDDRPLFARYWRIQPVRLSAAAVAQE